MPAVSHKFFRVIAVLAVLTALPMAAAWGQGVPRYQPSRPTVSPYLNLLRANPSAVPNYYSFVRPEFQQRAFNQQQLEVQRRQNSALLGLKSEIARGPSQGPSTGSPSRFQAPGSRSQFMNSAGYFGALQRP